MLRIDLDYYRAGSDLRSKVLRDKVSDGCLGFGSLFRSWEGFSMEKQNLRTYEKFARFSETTAKKGRHLLFALLFARFVSYLSCFRAEKGWCFP